MGDGYVSLEVSPRLARDMRGTLEEARRLWRAVDRPNLMIKVPGTPQGIDALPLLIAEGINVNVTLLFSQDAYQRVAESYIAGLEALSGKGGDPNRVASVASFFVSRIDTAVDKLLTLRLKNSADAKEQALLRGVMGKAAIANARQAYQRYLHIFSGANWEALAARGARTQRVLLGEHGAPRILPAYSDAALRRRADRPMTSTCPLEQHRCIRPSGRPAPSSAASSTARACCATGGPRRTTERSRRARRGSCKQYYAFSPLPGMNVNGELTLGENIGDLSGLAVAYKAYQMSLGGKPAPVIDGFTGDQRFFLGWAQVWARKYRDDELRKRLLTDPHSPSEYRCNGVAAQHAGVRRRVRRQARRQLYLPPEQQVRIW